jgi:hypothetical protein
VGNNNRATNSSGFTALPGGYRYDSGTYVARGGRRWWSSTQDSGTSARFLSVNSYMVWIENNDKTFGFVSALPQGLIAFVPLTLLKNRWGGRPFFFCKVI